MTLHQMIGLVRYHRHMARLYAAAGRRADARRHLDEAERLERALALIHLQPKPTLEVPQ